MVSQEIVVHILQQTWQFLPSAVIASCSLAGLMLRAKMYGPSSVVIAAMGYEEPGDWKHNRVYVMDSCNV